jgi:hypothetical protein
LSITSDLAESHPAGVEEVEEEVHVDLARTVVSRVREQFQQLSFLDDEHPGGIDIRTGEEGGVMEWMGGGGG